MAQQEQQMPSSFGGLVQYYDEGEQMLQLDPKVLIATITGTITLELILKLYIGV